MTLSDQIVALHGVGKKHNIQVLRHKHVQQKLGVSGSKLFEMIATGLFPKPFLLIPGGRAVGWLEHSVDAWLLERKDAANQTSCEGIVPDEKRPQDNRYATPRGMNRRTLKRQILSNFSPDERGQNFSSTQDAPASQISNAHGTRLEIKGDR
jgi:prophage regulatory protein